MQPHNTLHFATIVNAKAVCLKSVTASVGIIRLSSRKKKSNVLDVNDPQQM